MSGMILPGTSSLEEHFFLPLNIAAVGHALYPARCQMLWRTVLLGSSQSDGVSRHLHKRIFFKANAKKMHECSAGVGGERRFAWVREIFTVEVAFELGLDDRTGEQRQKSSQRIFCARDLGLSSLGQRPREVLKKGARALPGLAQ